jgi:hypothetical protein
MEKTLAKDEIDILRSHGVLNSHEIALRIGDIIIAENVVTRERRVLDNADKKIISENLKRLLKG